MTCMTKEYTADRHSRVFGLRKRFCRPLTASTAADPRRSVLAYVVVGDPKKGLVGLGRGRGKAPAKAVEAAFYNGKSISRPATLRTPLHRGQIASTTCANTQPSCKWTRSTGMKGERSGDKARSCSRSLPRQRFLCAPDRQVGFALTRVSCASHARPCTSEGVIVPLRPRCIWI